TNVFFGLAVFRAPFEVPLKVIDGTRVILGQGTSYTTAVTNAAVIRFQRDRSLTSRHHISGKALKASEPTESIPSIRGYLQIRITFLRCRKSCHCLSDCTLLCQLTTFVNQP